MKKTKWLAAVLMTAALVMGTCPAALADDETSTNPTIDITKIYSLLNEGTEAPADNFTFTITKEKVENSSITSPENMPTLTLVKTDEVKAEEQDNLVTLVTISYGANVATKPGFNKVAHLNFPMDSIPVGEYTYEIRESKGTTGGVVYDDQKVVKAKVTVHNRPEGEGVYIASITYTTENGKEGDGEGFVNRYQAGDLEISKKVTGNLGDKNKYFEIYVTLTGDDKTTYPDAFKINHEELSHESYKSDVPTQTISIDTQTKIYLKNGETFRIKNVPYGVTYTVKEVDYTAEADGGYDAAKYVLNGTRKDIKPIENEKLDNASETVEIINNKQTGIDTGVILDNMPYIVLLIVVIGAAVALFLRRRTDIDRD